MGEDDVPDARLWGVSVPLIVFTGAETDDHETPAWHPEHRGRLDAALAGVHEAGLDDATEWRVPDLAAVADLVTVHAALVRVGDRGVLRRRRGEPRPGHDRIIGFVETARRTAGAVLGGLDALTGRGV